MIADLLVSVIITTRNSERTLKGLLESVKKQTYPGIEIIVVDNHSRDATREIARRYAAVFTRGPERSAQRNLGAKKAQGTYYLFLDSDMELSKRVVEECVGVATSPPYPQGIFIPEISVGKGFWIRCRALERGCYQGDILIEAARFFAAELFWKAGGFDENITGPEDWDLSQKILKLTSPGWVSAPIYHHEEDFRLLPHLQKKMYYARGYVRYARNNPQIALQQGNLLFRAAFFRNWKKLLSHPLLSLGIIVLKSLETGAGLVGVIQSVIKK